MNILFISRGSKSLGVAERVRNEGHKVSFYSTSNARIGEGVVNTVTKNNMIARSDGYEVASCIDSLLSECDPQLVVFDSTGVGRVADYIRKKGIAVVGGSRWADDAELDKSYSNTLMRTVGIPVPPVLASPNAVVVDCEMWWNGLTSCFHNISFVNGRFMNDDVGPWANAGNVIKSVRDNAKIVKEGIGKISRLLCKTTYRGPISLKSFVEKDKLHGFSLSVGFTLIHSLLELYHGSIVKLLWAIATCGVTPNTYYNDYAIAVRVSVPPYPNNTEAMCASKVEGINRGNSKHIWWGDISLEDDIYKSASSSGNLLVATARGRDVIECRKRVYRTISGLTIEDKQYRTDVGCRVSDDERLLREWGWL